MYFGDSKNQAASAARMASVPPSEAAAIQRRRSACKYELISGDDDSAAGAAAVCRSLTVPRRGGSMRPATGWALRRLGGGFLAGSGKLASCGITVGSPYPSEFLHINGVSGSP